MKTFSQIGKSKLYLLSTLSEADQEKITTENDVESIIIETVQR